MDSRHINRFYTIHKAIKKANKLHSLHIQVNQFAVLNTCNLLPGYSNINQINLQLKKVNRSIHPFYIYNMLSELSNLKLIDIIIFGSFYRYGITSEGKEYLASLERYIRLERYDK